MLSYTQAEFLSRWQQDGGQGLALLLEPAPQFYEEEDDEKSKGIGAARLFRYLWAYKPLIVQLCISLLAASALQLIFPFLTQSVIDIGVHTHNLSYVSLVLVAQLMLTFGRVLVEFIRSWLLLYISSRINLSLLSDFFIKLMRLPLSFFDVKLFGDLMQRISDHSRIERFLTGTSLNVLFSIFNLFIFGAVLAFYHLQVFFIFFAGSVLYACWIVLFLKYRRKLDYKQFALSAQTQSNVVQLIQGMQEIKLANAEMKKRWEWERLQARNFKLDMKSLALSQYQQAGAVALNEGKNIFITFLAAEAVISGQLTLGAMMAMQYIIGQLNAPIQELIQFVQNLQDAQISLERINEIHEQEEEDSHTPLLWGGAGGGAVSELWEGVGLHSLHLQNVSFQYAGTEEAVLKDINLTIPQGKTTAIVGTSGSGKTTLLKLLLKFYTPSKGEIKLAETPLKNISHHFWRSICGTVLQDSFIFSDTIAGNIGVGDENIDVQKLLQAVKIANIQEFIEGLPLGYNTKIGAEGVGISQGQKQRLLIARAVYKNPEFIFFDEATNALDAQNESIITQNLEKFFSGKTVVVVAHRLSTVRNAANIIVLEKGKIVEQGTHHELIYKEGKYYELVRNQLDLGK